MAKHRLFVCLDARICPGHQLIVIAREDDTIFGILHSRSYRGRRPTCPPSATRATLGPPPLPRWPGGWQICGTAG